MKTRSPGDEILIYPLPVSKEDFLAISGSTNGIHFLATVASGNAMHFLTTVASGNNVHFLTTVASGNTVCFFNHPCLSFSRRLVT